MNSPAVPIVTKPPKVASTKGLWAICLGSFGSAVFVVVGILTVSNIGCKNSQKPTQAAVPSYQYYVTQSCWTAYDTNNNRVLYLHNNGYWYDFPPQVRQYTY